MANDTNRFAWERAVMGSDLTPTTRLVMLTLATYMDNDTRRVRIGQPKLAAACNLTERAVRKHLSLAIEAGWLHRLQRGHRLGDGVVVASAYEGQFATSTGTEEQVETDSQPEQNDTLSPPQPEHGASQPEPECASTGTTVPPITKEHSVEHSSKQEADAIDLEVRRQIRAKRDRGEEIRNEARLAEHIRKDVIRNRELDAKLDAEERARAEARKDKQYLSALCLGRNLVGVVQTEREARESIEADVYLRGKPLLIEEAVDAWRRERAYREQTKVVYI